MFKPTSAKDRLNYGDSLMPPAGYRLERAVGTTYSLDFETLTATAISLGLIEEEVTKAALANIRRGNQELKDLAEAMKHHRGGADYV